MGLLRFLVAAAFLVVRVDAEIQIWPDQPVVVHDMTQSITPVLFTCEAAGKSVDEAQLMWYKNDVPIAPGSSGSALVESEFDGLKLKIPAPTEADEGTYTCKGTIDDVVKQDAIKLTIYKGINFISPKDQFAVKGTNATVWCRRERTSLNTVVVWYRLGTDGKSWHRIVPNNTYHMAFESAEGKEGDYLQINNVSLSDSGTYICNVDIRTIGKAHTHFIHLTVTIPPEISRPITLKPPSPSEGERLELSCMATGTPEPTYMFLKDGQELLEEPVANGLFVIESVQREDEGQYVCRATNKGGVDTFNVEVDVRIPPAIISNENIEQQEGERVRLGCEATGDPAPTIFWRRRGSQVDILPDVTQEMYVEEQGGEPQLDGVSKVYRRTVFLVIPSLRSSHAGDYVCKASNDAGEQEKEFNIIVYYQPNFDDQTTSVFYGWLNGGTNLTCITNGNPEPVISWLRNNEPVVSGSDHVITNGQSGLSTRAISYLIPTVSSSTMGSIFGLYTCQAMNRYNTVQQNLEFRQAVVPEPPAITVVRAHPTALELRLAPPENNGGQPVMSYMVKHKILDSSDDYVTEEVRRFQQEASTERTLSGLIPNTQYSIKAYAVNKVGIGQERDFRKSTTEISKPERVTVTSSREGLSASTYTLTWDIPMNGGATISNYHVEYAVADEVNTKSDQWTAVRVSSDFKIVNVDKEETTQVTLRGLERQTYYRVKITAVNKIDGSDVSTFVFRTGLGDDESSVKAGSSLGAGGIVGLIIVLLLLLLLAVDAAFCKTKQCGAIWTISQALGRKEEGAGAAGKSPEDGDEAAAKLLGKEKDDTLRTENEVAKNEETAEEAEPLPEADKELEPEDKEEKPITEPPKEEPVAQKPAAVEQPEAPTPTPAPASEATPEVATQPSGETKPADQAANA